MIGKILGNCNSGDLDSGQCPIIGSVYESGTRPHNNLPYNGHPFHSHRCSDIQDCINTNADMPGSNAKV